MRRREGNWGKGEGRGGEGEGPENIGEQVRELGRCCHGLVHLHLETGPKASTNLHTMPSRAIKLVNSHSVCLSSNTFVLDSSTDYPSTPGCLMGDSSDSSGV